MSEPEATAEDRGGGEWDAPNQQVVREDQSAPWEEGTGGTPDEPTPTVTVESGSVDLDEMTKEQLLEYGRSIGASPANHSMTKDELRASVDEKLAQG